jgi:hypothetical protein
LSRDSRSLFFGWSQCCRRCCRIMLLKEPYLPVLGCTGFIPPCPKDALILRPHSVVWLVSHARDKILLLGVLRITSKRRHDPTLAIILILLLGRRMISALVPLCEVRLLSTNGPLSKCCVRFEDCCFRPTRCSKNLNSVFRGRKEHVLFGSGDNVS